MPVALSLNTGQPIKSESAAISASDSNLSTICWSKKNRYCAGGIPSAGSRVVFAQLRKYGKVCDRGIVTAQSPCILSKHEIC